MQEQLSKVSRWIAQPVAILAVLVGAGAIGAALALAIDGGRDDASTRFDRVAERFTERGDERSKDGDRHGGGAGEDGEHGEDGHGNGVPYGFGEPFRGAPEDFERFRGDLESFRDCLEDEGVEPFRGSDGGFGGFGGELGPGSRGEPGRGFFREFESSGVALETSHSRSGPGFRRGGEFDFEALRQALEACSDQLPEGLQRPCDSGREPREG